MSLRPPIRGALQRRRCLVTGGCGFIGSHLVERLVEEGAEVVVLDDLSAGFRENLDAVASRVKIVVGDVADPAVVGRAVDAFGTVAGEPFEVVFHLASLFANQRSIEHPDIDARTTVMGTLGLLELCRRKAPRARFLFSSSSCVGQGGDDATPYALTKALAERYLRLFAQRDGLHTTALRLFNVYGPRDRPGRYRSVIPNFLARAASGEALTITGSGEETRDFTYVSDVVDAFVRAAVANTRPGLRLDVGTGIETRILELADTLLKHFPGHPPLERVGRRNWDATSRRCADTSAARDELGFSASVSLAAGLRRTVEWYRDELDAPLPKVAAR